MKGGGLLYLAVPTSLAPILADLATLLARLTAARANYLDNLNNVQLLNIPNLSTLTTTRIGYLDELAAANVPADIDTLLARLTSTRAGYLDNINNAQLLQVTAARLGYIDLLVDVAIGLAAIKAEVEGLAGAAMRGTDGAALAVNWTAGLATILANFTAARIGYLDYLANGVYGLAALEALIAAIPTNPALASSWTAALATALGNYTAARAGYLDELAAANIPTDLANIIAYVDELETRLTAARAGYLDNINQVGLLQVTATRAGYLDLLADVTNGLAAIKAEVEGLAGAAMRGTDSAALAATALSTAVWTNALATALADYTAARAAYLDNLIGTVSVAGSPYSQPDDLVEHDAIIVAAATQLVDIELDMSNLAQNNTVREYVQVDAANYRQVSAKVFPTDFDTLTKSVVITYPQKNVLYKITMQSVVLEGGAKNVPFRIMYRDLS